MNTKNITTTIALILIIIALLITSYFSYQYFLLSNNSKNSDTVEDVIKNENVGTEINEVEETNNDTSNLTTYSNSEYGIEFMYPSNYTIEENLVSSSKMLNIIFNKFESNRIIVTIKKDKINDSILYHLDNKYDSTKKIGSNNWYVFLINQIEHGTRAIFTTYKTKTNSTSYTVTFSGNEPLNSEQILLLESIKVK